MSTIEPCSSTFPAEVRCRLIWAGVGTTWTCATGSTGGGGSLWVCTSGGATMQQLGATVGVTVVVSMVIGDGLIDVCCCCGVATGVSAGAVGEYGSSATGDVELCIIASSLF